MQPSQLRVGRAEALPGARGLSNLFARGPRSLSRQVLRDGLLTGGFLVLDPQFLGFAEQHVRRRAGAATAPARQSDEQADNDRRLPRFHPNPFIGPYGQTARPTTGGRFFTHDSRSPP